MTRRRYSPDVIALNPQLAPHTTKRGTPKPIDGADTLMAHARQLCSSSDPQEAADARVVAGMQRERPFGEWRIDAADEPSRVAVEINGGRWQSGGGKHSTPRDREKVRQLQLAGWIVLEYLTEELTADPVRVIRQIAGAVRGRRGSGL